MFSKSYSKWESNKNYIDANYTIKLYLGLIDRAGFTSRASETPVLFCF